MRAVCYFTLTVSVVFSLTGCGPDGTLVARSTREGVLLVGNGAEPQNLDPHTVTGVPEHRICSALLEGLVNLDPATLEPIPGVAEVWTVSEDQKTYTFTLRSDAKWSNGDPVTAHDFAYSWQRILSPSLASEYAYMLFCIEKAKAFNEGALKDFHQVGVEAVDERTLRVTLENPTSYFLAMQFHTSWLPVHRGTIERFGAMAERGTKWTRPENFVGNGAFTLKQWLPNEIIVCEKNPHYWGADAVRLNAVRFYPIEDTLTEERSFRSGRLHLSENVPIDKIEVYERDKPQFLHIDPYFGSYYYRFNVTREPFNDVRVRRALAMAVDRESLVRNVVKGGRKAAGCLTPPDPQGYTCATSIGFDVDEARRLLAEAGYPGGEGFPKVELLYNTSESHRQIAEAVQYMWKTNLNIDVQLLNQDWKVYLSSMSNLDYQIARSAWIGDVLDPINFLECFVTGGGNNRTGWSSPAYDALIAEAARAGDREARFAVFQRAERLLLDEMPIVPVYFYTRVYLMSPDVRGWESNLLGHISFKDLYLEPTTGTKGG
jgi:oligopeptide transport system substrate-binding protein